MDRLWIGVLLGLALLGGVLYTTTEQPDDKAHEGVLAERSASLSEDEATQRGPQVLLGGALNVNDGLATRSLSACRTQGVALFVTIPHGYDPEMPLYLNGVFDWTDDGKWAGTIEACGVSIPEWAIQNLRLNEAPYKLSKPGVYRLVIPVTSANSGDVAARLAVSTSRVPVDPRAREWQGQGEFELGEAEEWSVQVIEGAPAFELQDTIPTPPVVAKGDGPTISAGPPVQKLGEPLRLDAEPSN